MPETSTKAHGDLRPQADASTFPLLAELLAEQQKLETPVSRFSELHDAGRIREPFRELIPLSKPGPGEQYSFEVDLDRCSGCKACVAACHSLNGLDDEETWRDVGALVGTSPGQSFHQTITSACHHCADPGCMNGCPVLAYEKDPVTGIVRHLDDQCIGCQYCVLKCPYDVPKYNDRLGIVRKCDMCHSRLAVGEAPACVQACPTEAIRIVKIQISQAGEGFLPVAPDPEYTRPTTTYISKLPLPSSALPADDDALRVQPAHSPLAILLVTTQVALGMLAAAVLFPIAVNNGIRLTCFALFGVGLAASVAHLGQPLRAWRILLNLRKSWLSREALFLGLASLPFAVWSLAPFVEALARYERTAGAGAAVFGIMGVVCSAMIYIDTRRTSWSAARTSALFAGSVLIGATVVINPLLAAVVTLGKLVSEFKLLASKSGIFSCHPVTARLLRGPLSRLVKLRAIAGVIAVASLATWLWPLGFLALLTGEILERVLFFKSTHQPKMPGVPSSR